ncbi:muscle M-line assembly protein unc-89-like, partial [Pollicipes pollicipes]|uniref:muscle M-line assembly protein unc-89-like n=1 Tax=Pollicipes pollicipes TaxID=41117 RepID=UPI001884EA17
DGGAKVTKYLVEYFRAEFNIQFSGSPLPTVHWYKNKEKVQLDDRCQIVTLGERSSLLLHPALLEDNGAVSCELINPLGAVTSSARLQVEAPPYLRPSEAVERGLTFAQDEVIRVSIPYSAHPTPTFTWLHGDEELTPEGDDRVATSWSESEATLRISDARPADGGQYTLSAVSETGGDVVVFHIAIRGVPGPPGKPEVRHLSSKCLTLEWAPSDYDGGAKVTKYLVEYFRTGWDVWLKAVTSRSRTAQVFDLMVGSEVRFRVRSENSHGLGQPGPESEPCVVPEPTDGEDDLTFEQYSMKSSISEPELDLENLTPSRKKSRRDDFAADMPSDRPSTRDTTDRPVRPAVTSEGGRGARPRSPSAGREAAGRPRGISPFYQEASDQKATEPPLLTVSQEPIVGYTGETTIITVGLEGAITSLTWHHDGQPLVEDDHYHIRRVAEGTQLSIADSSAADGGRYTVTCALGSAGPPPPPPKRGQAGPPAAASAVGSLVPESDDYTPFVRRGRAPRAEKAVEGRPAEGGGEAAAAPPTPAQADAPDDPSRWAHGVSPVSPAPRPRTAQEGDPAPGEGAQWRPVPLAQRQARATAAAAPHSGSGSAEDRLLSAGAADGQLVAGRSAALGQIPESARLETETPGETVRFSSEAAPRLVHTLYDRKVKVGERLALSVKASDPQAVTSVQWYNKGRLVEPSDKYSVDSDPDGSWRLQVSGVELCDDGEWRAEVTAPGGVTETWCNIVLAVPRNYRKPRFMETLRAMLTDEGLVSFECKVVGYPTPLLRWFKDGQELKPGDVYQLSGTNSLGVYACLARNCMGTAESTAELTLADIENQLTEEERCKVCQGQLPPRFTQGLLPETVVSIADRHRFTIEVASYPEPDVAWFREEEPVQTSEMVTLSRGAPGKYHLDLKTVQLEDQGEWRCVATNPVGQAVTTGRLTVNRPRHYKAPYFLEPLRASLTETGTVNLQCKVVGTPQPALKWYKDGHELKAGDIHRITSGGDGTCCLGNYTCEAFNCMGSATSSAALLGLEEMSSDAHETTGAGGPCDAATPDAGWLRGVGGRWTDAKCQLRVGTGEISLQQVHDILEAYSEHRRKAPSAPAASGGGATDAAEVPSLRVLAAQATSGNVQLGATVIDVSLLPADQYLGEIGRALSPPELRMTMKEEDGPPASRPAEETEPKLTVDKIITLVKPVLDEAPPAAESLHEMERTLSPHQAREATVLQEAQSTAQRLLTVLQVALTSESAVDSSFSDLTETLSPTEAVITEVSRDVGTGVARRVLTAVQAVLQEASAPEEALSGSSAVSPAVAQEVSVSESARLDIQKLMTVLQAATAEESMSEGTVSEIRGMSPQQASERLSSDSMKATAEKVLNILQTSPADEAVSEGSLSTLSGAHSPALAEATEHDRSLIGRVVAIMRAVVAGEDVPVETIRQLERTTSPVIAKCTTLPDETKRKAEVILTELRAALCQEDVSEGSVRDVKSPDAASSAKEALSDEEKQQTAALVMTILHADPLSPSVSEASVSELSDRTMSAASARELGGDSPQLAIAQKVLMAARAAEAEVSTPKAALGDLERALSPQAARGPLTEEESSLAVQKALEIIQAKSEWSHHFKEFK